MSRRDRARTIALYTGGGLGSAAAFGIAGIAGVMWGEVKLAERRIPIAVDPPPLTDDTIWTGPGVGEVGKPIELVMLGDSTAAGYGAMDAAGTPGATLAVGISEATGRPVHVANVAVVGAESKNLPEQVDALGADRPDLAVIMIGANDVVERTKPSTAVRFLEDAVHRLSSRGIAVIVCTCPDLGVIAPLAQPLRAYARRLSRSLAREQTVAVVRAGGRTVSLGDLLGPLFAERKELFADDRFHPSSAGYAEAAAAVLPSCLDALGLETTARSASTFTTRRSKPIEKAAAQAAARPGSEVAASPRPVTAVGNRARTWARLRRREPAPHDVASATGH